MIYWLTLLYRNIVLPLHVCPSRELKTCGAWCLHRIFNVLFIHNNLPANDIANVAFTCMFCLFLSDISFKLFLQECDAISFRILSWFNWKGHIWHDGWESLTGVVMYDRIFSPNQLWYLQNRHRCHIKILWKEKGGPCSFLFDSPLNLQKKGWPLLLDVLFTPTVFFGKRTIRYTVTSVELWGLVVAQYQRLPNMVHFQAISGTFLLRL